MNVNRSRRALSLASDPGKFLSTVQIGITLVGVLSGAFSGATIGLRLASWLMGFGMSASVADAIGIGARAIERLGAITSHPILGGLHHQYCRI